MKTDYKKSHEIEKQLREYPQFKDCIYSHNTISMNIYFPNNLGDITIRIPSQRAVNSELKKVVTLVGIGIEKKIRGQGITHIVLDVLESLTEVWGDISNVEVESAESLEILRILEKRGYKKIPGQSEINFYSSVSFS